MATELPESEGAEVIFQPEEIMGIRAGKTEDVDKEVLICWKNLPNHEATWEPMDTIQRQFLGFHLEDKVILWEGGNNTNRGQKWGNVYQRRCEEVMGGLGNY